MELTWCWFSHSWWSLHGGRWGVSSQLQDERLNTDQNQNKVQNALHSEAAFQSLSVCSSFTSSLKSDSQFKPCHRLDTRKKCNSNFSDSNLETLNQIPAKLHCQEKREKGSDELAMFSAKSLSFLLSQMAEHKSRMNSLRRKCQNSIFITVRTNLWWWSPMLVMTGDRLRPNFGRVRLLLEAEQNLGGCFWRRPVLFVVLLSGRTDPRCLILVEVEKYLEKESKVVLNKFLFLKAKLRVWKD